jgi:hypothetical protein
MLPKTAVAAVEVEAVATVEIEAVAYAETEVGCSLDKRRAEQREKCSLNAHAHSSSLAWVFAIYG